MNPPRAFRLRPVVAIAIAALAASIPVFAQANATDLTPAFIKAGAVIESLTVVQISDIVLIRGRTNDAAKAAAASRIATELGYRRVANLIVIRDDVTDDAAITYTAQRRLELEPALEGCRFRVVSHLGVVRLTGTVHRDLQGDMAVGILSRIDGVKSVQSAVVTDIAHD